MLERDKVSFTKINLKKKKTTPFKIPELENRVVAARGGMELGECRGWGHHGGGTVFQFLYFNCISVNILVEIFHCGFARCYHWGNWVSSAGDLSI